MNALSILELQSFPITSPAAFLCESGKEGLFLWREGDYSSSVAIDPVGGVYLPSCHTSSTLGVWERVTTSRVDVRWFGATGDGDDSAAVQAACDFLSARGGGIVFFPAGIWTFTDVVVNGPISFEGEGRFVTTVKAAAPTGVVLKTNYQWCAVRHMQFTADQPRTADPYIDCWGSFSTFEDLKFTKGYGAIQVNGTTKTTIRNVEIYDTTPGNTAPGSYIIKLGPVRGVGTVIDDVLADNPNGQPTFGIIACNADALIISNCDIIRCGVCLAFMPGQGQSVDAAYVTNSYFDSAIRGFLGSPSGNGSISRPSFSNVWFCSHSADAFLLAQCVGNAIITGCRANLNAARGYLFGPGAGRVIMSGGSASENGSDGIALGPGMWNFIASGMEASNNGGGGIMFAGNNDAYSVTGCILAGNAGGAHPGHSPSGTKIISACVC